MNKRTVFLLVFILLTTLSSCTAQNSEVYEIPFSLDKKLLVFKGKLNGIDTDFAFDTGAAEGIATTKQEENKGIERKKSTQKIADANGQTGALTSVITKEMSIGGYTFSNVRATIGDMQYFYCMNLYLLGADIIRKLNWEIDFKRMVLKVSKSRFATDSSMAVMPVNYKYNRPRVAIKINDTSYDDVLIDIGYTGVMTLPNTD
ncbi:MAG: clan AA aspartic protease [Bacteroidia bacterium]|nr:clan AA aspartic protease [Bacteroidia bacterium]